MKALGITGRSISRPALQAGLMAAMTIGPVSHAVTVTNLSSNTSVFADTFESGSLSASIGAWSRIGPSVNATSSTTAPAPGPAEGNFYTSIFRNSNTSGQGDLVGTLGTAQSVAGDVIRLSAMVNIPSDGVLYRSNIFLADGDFINFRAWAQIDGAGNVMAVGPGFVRTDTGIDYTPDTWQRWELTYEIGSTSFSVRVGNASASGFEVFSAGQVSTVGFGNGSQVPGAFYLDAAPVPEPATFALMLAGVLLVGSLSMKRHLSREGDRQ